MVTQATPGRQACVTNHKSQGDPAMLTIKQTQYSQRTLPAKEQILGDIELITASLADVRATLAGLPDLPSRAHIYGSFPLAVSIMPATQADYEQSAEILTAAGWSYDGEDYANPLEPDAPHLHDFTHPDHTFKFKLYIDPPIVHKTTY
jgi:hypothetical protein